jgi:hypothetical protein
MHPGQEKLLAQEVDEEQARFHVAFAHLAVDGYGNVSHQPSAFHFSS